jgi:PAS domain S-box-containing protein
MFGYTAEEAIGQPVTMLMPPERVDEEPGILERIRRGEKVDHYETVRRRKDGSRFQISLSVSPIFDADGRVIGASKIARDISERVRAEQSRRQMEMMQRIVRAQEAERHRIARDLRDALGQKMTGLRLMIGSLLDKCGGYDPVSFEFRHLKEITAQMDQDIGFLSWELRPTELDTLGLVDAVRSFVWEWSRQFGIEADFQDGGAEGSEEIDDLPDEVQVNLYRIVQEALNNVLKHSSASSVNVVLSVRKADISLSVEDNGKGFEPSEIGESAQGWAGSGIVGMRERAEIMGGKMDVETSPGSGTTILVRIPRHSGENGNGLTAKAA